MSPDADAKTLVVYCSSRHYVQACDDFVEKELKITEYDLLAVPGGPQFLCALEYMPKLRWVGRRWVDFLVESHGLERVVLISHQNCAWYRRLHGAHDDHEAHQLEDLRRARVDLMETLPGLRVDAYFAFREDGKVKFNQVS